MTKYLVTTSFDDLEDGIRYPEGALYPRDNYLPSEERIAMLLNPSNLMGIAVIRPLIELPAKNVENKDSKNQQEPSTLSRDEIKAQLDAAGIKYAKNAKTETLLEILEASKLGE